VQAESGHRNLASLLSGHAHRYGEVVRIVSLLPSATEIVAELGLLEHLVGRSEECDYPEPVRALPVVSASRVDTSKIGGAAIDRAVREALAAGASLYALDADLLARLRPDVIVTQDLCRVCAVASGEVCDVDARVVSLDPRTLAEIADSVRSLGRELGRSERGAAVATRMEVAVEAVRARVAGRARRRVVLAEWLDPPFACGHWLPEMVEAAGGIDLLGRPGEPALETTWDAVAAAEPELVVAAPCGFDAERAQLEWRLATHCHKAARALRCPVVAVDANAYFARPSPRVAEGVAQLARLFHPAAFARAA
jgi:iron complex transport system substrate-binding protein